MQVLGWTVLLVLVVGGAAAGYWWWRFPGAAGFVFGPAFASDRAELTAARRHVRAQHRRVNRALSPLRKDVQSAQREQQKRIREAQRALDEARESGPGKQLGTLDSVVLYERSLQINGQDVAIDQVMSAEAEQPRGRGHSHTELVIGLGYGGVQREYYRDRSRVRPEPGSAKAAGASGVTKVTRATGAKSAAAAEGEMPLRSYREVRSFADRIRRAAAEERKRLELLPELLDSLERDLAEAKDDTGAIDEARTALRHAEARAERDPELLRARDELEDAREAWRELAGRLPPG
ncbi:hypothetical protein ABIA32_004297 [Streptacidiphilus sp. MAP12-20]|uniref:hypothetical protein n=1 Tax=Streptacidiphilus sp. MAP12-20 TaxID=3156299 RepID=UPI003518E5D5